MTAAPSRRITLTQQIFIGLAAGVLFGWFINSYHPDWVNHVRPFSQLFLRMIKMIIAPLIFSTLVAGIAGAGHSSQVGRMGLKALLYFEVVTTLALVIGLVAVNLTKPGLGMRTTLDPDSYDPALNDLGNNALPWCYTPANMMYLYGLGDYGTPDADNMQCP